MIDGKMLIDRTGEEPAKNSASRDASAVESSMHMLQIQNLIDAIHGNAPLLIDSYEGKKAIQLNS